MAKSKTGAARTADKAKRPPRKKRGRLRRVLRWVGLGLLGLLLVLLSGVALLRVVNPPINYYQAAEWVRHGTLERRWIPLAAMSPHLARSAVAAEDAKFCQHAGFDIAAIRAAFAGGAVRGGSTISQQTAKNVFLWQARSWVRKGLEAGFTALIELLWGKRRILEVYLNVAEFDTGVFGVAAASRHYFDLPAGDVGPRNAARLMAVLPSPKTRDPNALSHTLARRARQIEDGARTIAADGRAACFQP